ncbi:MAG: ABC transporter permease subunit, partial [Nitrososphaerales archaeon]
LITIGVLILISFVFLLSISQAQNSGFGVSNNPSPSLVGYYDNNGYHFIMYASNQFGQGVSGYTAKLNISSPTGQLYTGGGTTNSSGYTTFSIAAPQNANVTISYTIILPGGTGTESSAGIIPFMQFNKNGTESAVPAGDTVVVAGQGLIGTITDSTNSSRSDIRVFYVAPFGQVPINYAIYYKLINSTGTGFVNFGAQYNESQMQLLGTLSGYVSTFSPPAVPSGYSQGSYFEFELFYSNATQITSQVIFVSQLYAPSAPPIQVTSLVSLFFAGIFGFFIPLVAIIGTYNSYGKDRVNGVLESVLSRPVTRRGLSISRYLSTFAGMAVAIIIAIGVVDGLAYYFAHSFVDSTILLASTGAFLVDLAAFVGIMMLLSHLLKSSGALIGIGIGLFILMDFFWSLIIFGLTAALQIAPGTPGYNQVTISMQFANPAEFVSLVLTYLTGSSSGFGFITPSQYGITIPSLVAAGVLWIAIPFAIYLYLATKRD